jgi:hypothetical protein
LVFHFFVLEQHLTKTFHKKKTIFVSYSFLEGGFLDYAVEWKCAYPRRVVVKESPLVRFQVDCNHFLDSVFFIRGRETEPLGHLGEAFERRLDLFHHDRCWNLNALFYHKHKTRGVFEDPIEKNQIDQTNI